MATQWDTWLAELKAAGKGGIRAKAIDRGLPYEYAMSIPLDVSSDTFTASLRVSPDASGSTIEDFTVDVGTYGAEVAGKTIVTLSLTQTQTAFADVPDGDLDGVEELVFDILRNNTRFLGGIMPIAGKVTNYV